MVKADEGVGTDGAKILPDDVVEGKLPHGCFESGDGFLPRAAATR